MASLLVVFVLLFVTTLNAGHGRRQVVQEELIKALRGQLEAAGLDEHWVNRDGRDKNAVVIVFPDSLLFDLGKADIDSRGQRTLVLAVPRLADVLCSEQFHRNIENVVIEGHTDTTYRGAPATELARRKNLELSQQRSMTVVSQSLTALEDEQRRDCFRSMLSASGRGQEEPLPNVPGDDAKQRRVIFKIRVQSDLATALSSSAQ